MSFLVASWRPPQDAATAAADAAVLLLLLCVGKVVVYNH